MTTILPGARGDGVRDVQTRLAALGYPIDPEEHGVFGQATEGAVREFQQRRELLVDGVVGEDTWQELVEAGRTLGDRVLYLRYPSYRGDDVRRLQARLNLLGFDTGREDGIFGERADLAVRDFQRNVGLVPDGIVGPVTLDALMRLRPVGPGPGRAMVREAEVISRMSATLDGSLIAVDAGHGPGDPGAVGPTGLSEAEATPLLAAALVEELSRRGAEPFLVRAEGDALSAAERARAANDRGAEILVSLHLNSHDDARAEGALCFYYGRERYVSRAGQRLAELIQEELTSRLGLKDGRTHPKSLPLLRETQMPAVHVEPCYITNPSEEALIGQERFRREVAGALADAIERFFQAAEASGSAEEATGTAGAAPGSGAGPGSGPGPGQPIEHRPQRDAQRDRASSA
jgi:N-acetylmuramoyl-L-alanine amidase